MGCFLRARSLSLFLPIALFLSQGQAGTSSLADQDSVTSASARSMSTTPPHQESPPATELAAGGGHTSTVQASAQGYFSWAYSALSPKLAAVATMASQSVTRAQASRPLPEPPADLYPNRRRSSSSTASTSKESSSAFGFSGANIFGISSSSAASTAQSRSADRPTGWVAGGSNSGSGMEMDSHATLRNRKISLYDDYEVNSDSKPYKVSHSAHSSESSWSSFTGHASPHSPAGDY